MTAAFNIYVPAISGRIEPATPRVSPLEILDLARLFHTDRTLALELAAASAAQAKEPTK